MASAFALLIYSKHFPKQQLESKVLPPSAEVENNDQSQVLPGSIAVFDVEMLGNENEVDNWSFGLADLMTAMLEEKGGTVLERKDLKYVLSERKLQEGGLLKANEIVGKKLPWVKYLLQGSMEKTTAQTFSLTVYINDTESGRELSRFNARGSYPNELVHAVTQLSKQVLEKVGTSAQAVTEAPSAEKRPGFTVIPEAAILFYKGIEHFINGRPEFAAEYFHQAYEADPQFLVAMVWRKRAYERLGLAYLGNTIYQDALGAKTAQRINDYIVRNEAQLKEMNDHEKHTFLVEKIKEQNKEVIASIPSSTAAQKNHLVVAISKPVLSRRLDPELEQCLRKALEHVTEVEVFSPESIRALANEVDLPISGDFTPHQLQYLPWVAVDGIMTIAPVVLAENKGGIQLEFVDALSGELLAQAQRPVADGTLEDACKEGVDQIMKERRITNGDSLSFPKLLPLDYKPIIPEYRPTTQIFRYFYSPQNYSYILRIYADHPNDKVRLLNHLSSHEERKALPTIEQIETEQPYREALLDQLLTLIDKKEPDAPYWIFETLIERYYGIGLQMTQPINNEESFVPQLRTLVKEFPDSAVAIGARYALGHAAIVDGSWEEATELFIDVAEKLDGGALRANDSYCAPRIRGNVYFLAAGAAAQVGKAEIAKTYVARALEIAQKQEIRPVMIVVDRGGQMGCRDASIYANHEQIVPRGEPINDRIRQMYGRLNGAKQEFISLDDLYQQFKNNSGEARNKIGWQFFDVLLQQIEARVLIDSRNYNVRLFSLLGYLYRNTPKQKQAEVVELARKLNEALLKNSDKYKVFDGDRYAILIAVGLHQEALNEAKGKLLSQDAHARYASIKSVAWILHEMKDINGELHVLKDEALRYHQDFRKPDDNGAPRTVSENAELDFIDLIYRAAFAHRDAGQGNVAADLIKLALQRLFSERTNEDLAREHRASLKYHLACIEERMGNKDAALELLKEVVDESKSHPNYNIYFYNYAEAPAKYLYSDFEAPHVIYQGLNIGDMYPSAVKHIERLRGSIEK